MKDKMDANNEAPPPLPVIQVNDLLDFCRRLAQLAASHRRLSQEIDDIREALMRIVYGNILPRQNQRPRSPNYHRY